MKRYPPKAHDFLTFSLAAKLDVFDVVFIKYYLTLECQKIVFLMLSKDVFKYEVRLYSNTVFVNILIFSTLSELWVKFKFIMSSYLLDMNSLHR